METKLSHKLRIPDLASETWDTHRTPASSAGPGNLEPQVLKYKIKANLLDAHPGMILVLERIQLSSSPEQPSGKYPQKTGEREALPKGKGADDLATASATTEVLFVLLPFVVITIILIYRG
jgi:hypothetical protein